MSGEEVQSPSTASAKCLAEWVSACVSNKVSVDENDRGCGKPASQHS